MDSADGGAAVADDRETVAGDIHSARQKRVSGEKAKVAQPFRRRATVQAANDLELDGGLAAMQADGHVQVTSGRSRAAQQLGLAGLDPVGRQHGAHGAIARHFVLAMAGFTAVPG